MPDNWPGRHSISTSLRSFSNACPLLLDGDVGTITFRTTLLFHPKERRTGSREHNSTADSVIVPQGTPIRVALSQRVRIWQEGVPLTGRVTDTVYAFDQPVIAAGSEVRGT